MGSKCILIIDDEADIREIAKVSLQFTRGWSVIAAASGVDGIEIAVNKQPDVILLDVAMPHIDGLATLQRLKENPSTQHIPVILLTATVKIATRQRYAQFGAKAVMTKPFDPGALANHIEEALGWSVANPSL